MRPSEGDVDGVRPFAVDRQHRAHDAVRGQLRENLLEFLDTWPHADTNPKDATREARRAGQITDRKPEGLKRPQAGVKPLLTVRNDTPTPKG